MVGRRRVIGPRSFSRSELARHGFTSTVAAAHVEAGLLHEVAPGWLRATPTPSLFSATEAMLRRAGPRAAAIGSTAATIYGLDGFVEGDEGYSGLVEVGVDRRAWAPAGVQRVAHLDEALRIVAGLRVLAPDRVLAELGRSADADLVERAVECALRQTLVTEATLRDPACTAKRRGGPVLREVMARRPPGAPATGSDAETRCIQVLRAAGLPTPQRQVQIGVRGVVRFADLAWAPQHVICEVDSRRWHGADRAEADARRQNELTVIGWQVLRVTWFEIVTMPEDVVDLIARALEASDLRRIRQSQWRFG